jgi:hypothetical protein
LGKSIPCGCNHTCGIGSDWPSGFDLCRCSSNLATCIALAKS